MNLGGQIAPASRVDALRSRIGRGEVESWDAVHAEYEAMATTYPADLARHAWAVLRFLSDGKPLGAAAFGEELKRVLETRRWIEDQVYRSRAKDYRDSFRAATFRNEAEMTAVLGTAEDNSFVKFARKETAAFAERVETLAARLR